MWKVTIGQMIKLEGGMHDTMVHEESFPTRELAEAYATYAWNDGSVYHCSIKEVEE